MSKKFKLGVVGDPIEHSLSPFIHSRFSRNENVNINYLAYKVKNDDFDIFIKEFFHDKEARGLNITLPHKKKAASLEGEISQEARYINAVNTILNETDKLHLFSTDGVGFIKDIENKKFNLKNKNILIIGAGAAVESILYRVANAKPMKITVINRTIEKADRLIRKFGNMTKIESGVDMDKPFDLIINGSSAGLTGDFFPEENIPLTSKTYFYDLNYSLTETPFCKWAKEKSDNVYDGMGMLVYQAAYSFEKWFNVFPNTDTVINDLEAMRE
jgi:shikimate dehydrogenase